MAQKPVQGDKRALLIDFDGTAAMANVGMALIHEFARDDSWKVIDDDYLEGRIGSRIAYRLMGPLLNGSCAEWREFALDNHRLDPELGKLTGRAAREGYLVEILSDGLDLYIDALLGRAGIELGVKASTLVPQPGAGASVQTPYMNPLCGRCGTCKREHILDLKRGGYTVVFAGDGLSDLCAAPAADLIFAKDILADHLTEKGVAFRHFSSMDDIFHVLFES